MKKILLFLSILLFTAAPSFGQITVFDPSNLKQQVQQLINMSQQLTQLQKTFALYQQQFNLLNSEAQSIKSLPTRYRYTFTNGSNSPPGISTVTPTLGLLASPPETPTPFRPDFVISYPRSSRLT